MSYFYTAAWILACLSILGTIASQIRSPYWWIRGWDYPRPQLAFLALLSIGLLVISTAWSWMDGLLIALLLGVLLWQGWRIFPYTALSRSEVKRLANNSPLPQISILVSNVLTPNRQSDRLIKLIKKWQPDVILTLETDQWWQDQLSVLTDFYPHQVQAPQDNLYGMHLFCKLPLSQAEVKFLVEDDIPSIHTHLSLSNGQKVKFVGLHPRPPAPQESTDSVGRDAELLIVAKQVAKLGLPQIVAGDFNDVAWSHTTRLFRRISQMHDPRRGRGFFATFHAKVPLMRWPLDHLFHTSEFALIEIKRLGSIGSDHFPIYVKLALAQSQSNSSKEIPEADESDHKEAKERINRAQ